jgi:uncharacterized protein (TIGR00730 family)
MKSNVSNFDKMKSEGHGNGDDKPSHFHVCIFGSARIKEGDPNYKLVRELSTLIAEEGMDVVTGGGPGIMEAASRGHREGRKDRDTHSIGLNIRLPKEQESNQHLDIKREFSRFSERLDNFMLLSNVVVVAPGGIGTLLEFFYTWQLVQVKHICDIPIILLGDMWGGLIKWIEKWPLKNELISPEDMHTLFLASDCQEAMKVIRKCYEEFNKGASDFCLTYKKYRIE